MSINNTNSKYMTDEDIHQTVTKQLENIKLDNKRLLLIVPDHTRSGPVGKVYKAIYDNLSNKVQCIDALVALGTHPPMPMEQICHRLEITPQEWETKYTKTKLFNHAWKDENALTCLGIIPEQQINEISGGLFSIPVSVTLNKLPLEYDHIMIIGPVFPHEVVGFSGGNKYLFPGIAGQEIIDFFHWLGALITNIGIIGNKNTPVREVINTAVKMFPVERSCFAMVVEGKDMAGLYFGTPETAWNEAADHSNRIHIIYKEKPYNLVVSCAPLMYDDLWVGGKCMYKMEPVVADGGKLIIYAPHITDVSVTHGAVLDEIGYHTRDFFVKQWDKYKDYPWGVVAHSTHVKGIGTYENGIEKPRVEVILATGIPKERCDKINLGYINPDNINLEHYKNKEDEGILLVEKAGEVLYKLK